MANRTTTVKFCLLVATLGSSLTWAQGLAEEPAEDPAEDPFAAAEVKTTHVSGSVHFLEGVGGNLAVSVGPDGTLIVDDQFAQMAPKLMAAIDTLGGEQPKIILNTHWHGDHTGANPNFGSHGTIIAHHNVRIRLLAQPNYPRSGLPLVTYDDGIRLHFNDEDIHVQHLPKGHTDGDSVIWFKQANVIHLGDHFFNQRFPYVDIASGGSVDGLINNLEGLLDTLPDDIHIIPGHGPLGTKAHLIKTLTTVKDTAADIRARLGAGDNAADIAEDINRGFADWASGFVTAQRWVQIIQADLQAAGTTDHE